MIRRGKHDKWLQLPSPAFNAWIAFNDVEFERTKPGSVNGRGGALLAKEEISANAEASRVLMAVPRDLILSLERVQQHAKVDRDFKEVLDSLGEFGRTPRGAILSFLLAQASTSCPDLPHKVGVNNPFVDYIKSLPLEDLPSLWTSVELDLLVGTTLAPAIVSKQRSLHREYDGLRTAAVSTRWLRCVADLIDFDDWCQVDAMYRSRALDFPEIGHCMVPCIDLANHAANESTIAIYEKDTDGNAILLLRDDKHLSEGEEITITYGDEKGACEMIFSYGFLDDKMDSAKSLFLSLVIPEGDMFRIAKMATAECAPGFNLLDCDHGMVDWHGDFIWMLCVNEEDGLRYELARTVDGADDKMQAFLGNEELTGGAAQLHSILARSDLWDVYQLRAVTILQQRVFDQLQQLFTTQDAVEAIARDENSGISSSRIELCLQLRRLEFELMDKAYEYFEHQKNDLAQRPAVLSYLAEINQHD